MKKLMESKSVIFCFVVVCMGLYKLSSAEWGTLAIASMTLVAGRSYGVKMAGRK